MWTVSTDKMFCSSTRIGICSLQTIICFNFLFWVSAKFFWFCNLSNFVISLYNLAKQLHWWYLLLFVYTTRLGWLKTHVFLGLILTDWNVWPWVRAYDQRYVYVNFPESVVKLVAKVILRSSVKKSHWKVL